MAEAAALAHQRRALARKLEDDDQEDLGDLGGAQGASSAVSRSESMLAAKFDKFQRANSKAAGLLADKSALERGQRGQGGKKWGSAKLAAVAAMNGLQKVERRDRPAISFIGEGDSSMAKAPVSDASTTDDGEGIDEEGASGGRRRRRAGRRTERSEGGKEEGMAFTGALRPSSGGSSGSGSGDIAGTGTGGKFRQRSRKLMFALPLVTAGKGDGGGSVDEEGGEQQQEQAAATGQPCSVNGGEDNADGGAESPDELSPLAVKAEGGGPTSNEFSPSGNGGSRWTRRLINRRVTDDGSDVDDGEEGNNGRAEKAWEREGSARAGSQEGDVVYLDDRCLLREDAFGSPLSSPKSGSSSEDGSGSLDDEELHKIDEEVLHNMFKRVLDAKEQLDNYKNVLVFLVFVAIYFSMLCLQADSSRSYEVTLGHAPLIPEGFTMDSPNTFNSMTDFYSWLNDSIIQALWQDPVCGNGICERPLEFEAFGNLGCEADCGRYPNITTITVSMRTNFDTPAMMSESSWNLCMSEPLKVCWFDADQTFDVMVGRVTQQFNVPDGDWTVWLNVPHGGVRGMVLAPSPTVSRLAVVGTPQSVMLASWGDCVPPTESTLLKCRAVCARLVECLWGMDCANGLTQAAVSTAYVDCANDCTYANPIALQYENSTCSEVSAFLATQMFANVNCSSKYSRRGLNDEENLQPHTVRHFRSVRRRAFGYTTATPTDISPSPSAAGDTAPAAPAKAPAAVASAPAASGTRRNGATNAATDDVHPRLLRRTHESAFAASADAEGVQANAAVRVAPPSAEALPEAVTWFEVVKLYDQQPLQGQWEKVSVAAGPASSNGEGGSSSRSSSSSSSSSSSGSSLPNEQRKSAVDAAASLAAMFSGNESGSGNSSTGSSNLALSALSAMWLKLGSSDDQRLANVEVAVARLLYTAYGDKCLAEYIMNITLPRRQRLTAFFCTLFGGPFATRRECNYTDCVSGQQVTDFMGLYKALLHEHKGRGLRLSEQHLEHWVVLVVAAFESVTDLDEATSVQLSWILHAFDGAVVTPDTVGCNLEGSVLMWMQGEQERSSIRVGDKITWVWGDDNPQSIMYAGFGDPVDPIFKGFGSNRLVVSRSTRCDVKGVHGYDGHRDPSPCVLRSRKDTSTAFTYTTAFSQPGIIFYAGGRYGSSMSGVVTIQPRSNSTVSEVGQLYPGLMKECRPGCSYEKLTDGQCNAACYNPDCVFDGGDCACVSPDLDFPRCECSTGQTRDVDGSCCESTAIGEALSFPFELRYYGDNLTESMKSFHVRTGDALNRFVSSKESGSGYTLYLRLLVGMFIFQERSEGIPCSPTRLVEAVPWCMGGTSTKPFGVNPHFLPSSSLYDYEAATKPDAYDTSNFSQPIVYRQPGIPYGFQFPEGRDDYPLIFDINLDNRAATRRLQYLVDGFFVDNTTSTVTVAFVTYNGETRNVALTKIVTKIGLGGGLPVKYEVRPVRVQFYSSQSLDIARLVLELLWVVAVLWNVVEEVLEMVSMKMTTGAVVGYFQRPWNWVDLLSIGIQISCMALWIDMAVLANQIDPDIRYDVYTSLVEAPYYWSMPDPPTAYETAMAEYSKIEYLISLRNIYFSLQGINVVLITMRLLKLLDFQPYLGIITRSIRVAAPSIIHFFLLWFIVFTCFSLFGYLVFGAYMQQFSTVGESMLTCFLIILNDNDVYHIFMRLDGWLYAAGVIYLAAFTVIMVFVLLNFLIAIIVDAFMEVKDGDVGRRSTTIVEDVVSICKRAKWMASTRTWRYSTLLNQIYSLSTGEVRRMASTSLRRKPKSVIVAMVRGLWNHMSSSFGDHFSVGGVRRVIRINDRNLDSLSVNTVLQRSADRSRMEGQAGKRAKWKGGGVMAKGVDTEQIDVRQMSDALVGLLGQRVEVDDLPGGGVPGDSGATTSGSMSNAKKKYTLQDIHHQIRHLSSDSRHALAHLSEQMADSNATSLASLREEMREENERSLRQVKEDIQKENEKVLTELREAMKAEREQSLAEMKLLLLDIRSQLPRVESGSSSSSSGSRADKIHGKGSRSSKQ